MEQKLAKKLEGLNLTREQRRTIAEHLQFFKDQREDLKNHFPRYIPSIEVLLDAYFAAIQNFTSVNLLDDFLTSMSNVIKYAPEKIPISLRKLNVHVGTLSPKLINQVSKLNPNYLPYVFDPLIGDYITCAVTNKNYELAEKLKRLKSVVSYDYFKPYLTIFYFPERGIHRDDALESLGETINIYLLEYTVDKILTNEDKILQFKEFLRDEHYELFYDSFGCLPEQCFDMALAKSIEDNAIDEFLNILVKLKEKGWYLISIANKFRGFLPELYNLEKIDSEDLLDSSLVYSMSLVDILTDSLPSHEQEKIIKDLFKFSVLPKAPQVLEALVNKGNFSRNEFVQMLHDVSDEFEYFKNILKGAKFEINGYRGVKKFFKVVSYLYVVGKLDIKLDEDVIKNESLIKRIANYIKDKIVEAGYGNLEKVEKLRMYLPYVTEGDDFAKFLKAVINDGIPENYSYDLPNYVAKIKFEEKVDLAEMRNELSEYTNLFEKIIGEKIEIQEDDLSAYQEIGRKMLDELKGWKRYNAEKAKEYEKEINEIEPNLERILRKKEVEIREGEVRFEPYNFASQLQALAYVRSCLSPGGCNFYYTKHYFAHVPNIFWAVIYDDKKRIVGRATIGVGYDEDGNVYVARLSKEERYCHLPLSAKELDRAIAGYAKVLGAKIKKCGTLEIPGIGNEAYDDYLKSGSEPNVVKILKTPIAITT